MSRFIDRSMVAVQVETSRQDVWVPVGRALRQRSYYPDGLAVAESMLLPENLTRAATTTPLVGITAHPEPESRKKLPITSFRQTSSGNVSVYKDIQLPPVLAHTRVPMVVSEGDRVSMAGQFALRRTGHDQHNGDTSADFYGVDVRVSLWGIGTATDEYGVESDVTTELLTYQAQLQPYLPGSEVAGSAQVIFTLPAMTPAVVPAGLDRLHMSLAMRDNTGDRGWVSVTYDEYRTRPTDVNYITLSTEDPLRIYTFPPTPAPDVREHPVSATGVAFVNRHYFSNIVHTCEAVLLSPPDATGPVTVEVWEWSGSTRGASVATVTLMAGERRVIPVTSSTGQIDIASATPVWVESVTATRFESDTVEQNSLHRFTYTDIIDPVNTVKSERVEADLGIMTIRFVSDTVSSLLLAGKRIRVLGKWEGGGLTPVFTGTIRNRRIVHDMSGREQVEIAVHDSFGRLGVDCPVAFDTLIEYAEAVHSLGTGVTIDGVDFTGPSRPMPGGYDSFPSYTDEKMTLTDSLTMARNTAKAYLTVNRHDEIIVGATLPGVTLDVSDVDEADMSYSRAVSFESDTKNLVNIVGVTEHLTDRKKYVDRAITDDDPPLLLEPIESRTQSADYRRQSAIDLYGQSRVAFPVVRGSGSLQDLAADNYGPTFRQWASDVLDDHDVEEVSVRSLRLTVTSETIEMLARLEVLDAVCVRFRGTARVSRVRKVTHEIQPNKWTVDVDFTPTSNQVYWLPDTTVPLLALGNVDARTLSAPAPGRIDAGTLATTHTHSLDGGTL